MPILGIIASRDGGTPTAPTIGTATATSGTTATVAYTPSTYTGKGAATYTATSSPGGLTGTGASPITVSGLTSGTAYTFTVTATSTTGQTATSAASNSVTPAVPNYLNTLGYGNNIAYVSGALDSTASTSFAIGRISISGAQGGLIAAYNASGTLQWQRALGIASGTVPIAFTTGVIDSSGNVYAIGNSVPSGAFVWNVVKYNSSGTILWQRSYAQGGTISGSPYNATVDSSDNLYIVGDYDGTGKILKIDSSGTLLTAGDLGQGSRAQELLGIQLDSSGNIYVCGWFQSSTSGASQQSTLHKLNSSLTTQWTAFYQVASVADNFGSLYTDASGNSYAVGYANVGGVLPNTFVKFDTSGNMQWQRYISLGYTNGSRTGKIDVDSSGNIYVLTMNPPGSAGSSQINVFKYNTSGALQWQRSLTGSIGGSNGATIKVKGNNYYVYANAASNGAFTFNAPIDGSKTGTYTLNGISYTYAASSFTDAAGGGTASLGAYSVGGITPTTATTTLTASTPTYTSTTTTY